MPFRGLLIKESLTDQSVLDQLTITKEEVWDVENVAADQPSHWHAVWFEGPIAFADTIATKLAQSLKSNPAWYTNFTANQTVYVIFPNKVMTNTKGNHSQRNDVETYARTLSIPENQLDWSE